MTGAPAPQYLLAVYLGERRRSAPVSPGYVAEILDRSPAATTEMLQRLETRGYVTYKPYEGVTLTPGGRETAEELYDAYSTLARFFRDVLSIEDYEDEALHVVGTVSPTVTDRLAATLLREDDETGDFGSVQSHSRVDGV
ncbi:metal-dependent transcriptional regulator [Haloferacaceae archaeon DSL9]